jgi:hypothetical protein
MKTRKKKYGGSELIQKQLDDCVKETKVLAVKLEMKNEDNKDYIKRNAELDIIIQQIHERNVDLDKRLKITEERLKITEERLEITEERLKITEEKLTKVSQNFLENRAITAIYDVIQYEKNPPDLKKNTVQNPVQKTAKPYKGNLAYQNIDEKKLRKMRHNIAHYCLDNIYNDKPLYDQYKKYLFEKIKILQQENLPIVEYINKRLIDLSYNILDPIFDLDAFISILATETASVTITPEIRTEIDKWWNHGLI